MQKSSIKNWYNLSFILVFLGVIWFLFKNFDIFGEIEKVNSFYLIIILFLLFGVIYLNGIFLKIVAGVFGINLKEHFLISLGTSFFNLIVPFRAGLVMRAVYMKKKYAYSYANFAASIFGNYVVLFLVASILEICLLLAMYFIYGVFNVWFLLIFCGLFLVMLALIVFDISFRSENFILQKINQVMTGWRFIANKPEIVLKLSINTLLTFLIQGLLIQVTFLGIGVKISFLKALFIAVMNLLGVFISITPGSLGLTEALYVLAGTGLGISPALSLVVALIIRVANTLILLIFGPMANYLLMRRN